MFVAVGSRHGWSFDGVRQRDCRRVRCDVGARLWHQSRRFHVDLHIASDPSAWNIQQFARLGHYATSSQHDRRLLDGARCRWLHRPGASYHPAVVQDHWHRRRCTAQSVDVQDGQMKFTWHASTENVKMIVKQNRKWGLNSEDGHTRERPLKSGYCEQCYNLISDYLVSPPKWPILCRGGALASPTNIVLCYLVIHRWTCKTEIFSFYTASDAAIWILVSFTVDRFVAVTFPLQKRNICGCCSLRRTKYAQS